MNNYNDFFRKDYLRRQTDYRRKLLAFTWAGLVLAVVIAARFFLG